MLGEDVVQLKTQFSLRNFYLYPWECCGGGDDGVKKNAKESEEKGRE